MTAVTCIDLDKNTYEVDISHLRWRPSVYGIIIQDESILLVPQWDGYDLPGGGIDLGETIEDGLLREVREETGLECEIDTLIECKESFFKLPNSENRFIQSIMIYYTASVIGGTLSVDGFDEEEKGYAKLAEWIPLREIENIRFKSSVDILPILKKVIDTCKK